MFHYVEIDPVRNRLICSTELVGIDEVVEIWVRDQDSPARATGELLKKIKHPDVFIIEKSWHSNNLQLPEVIMGEACLFVVLKNNLSGKRLRGVACQENTLTFSRHDEDYQERFVNRAKTGTIRKKRDESQRVRKNR